MRIIINYCSFIMVGNIIAFSILLIALYGYYISVKVSKLEKEIRKENLNYKCFECKQSLSINEIKCDKCGLVTLYGSRKRKFWIIVPIIITWLFVFVKIKNLGI